MSTYTECLASFASWPHTSPTPEALAEAGFSHMPTASYADSVVCRRCNTRLCDWEPEDDPELEHLIRSGSCPMFQKRPPKSSSRISPPKLLPKLSPKPLTKDIGFLDPSLQYDFPELCLFHNAHTFCDRIEQCRSEFLEADILTLLPKCLRGEALTWFNQSRSDQDLTKCMQAMKAQFQQAAPQAAPKAINQSACHASEYHHCKLCNASFSSTARLIRHTQESNCNKPSCRQCEKVFSSRNQLYQHLREECQKQLHRRSSYSPTPLPAYLSPSPTPRILSPPPEENRASLPPSPPPTYRILSPPPPIYRVVKNFLTVEDLYARYTPQYLKVDDLFRMFGRRSARSSAIPTSARSSTAPTTPIAPRPTSIRHRGRRLAEKGDRSTNIPKHLIKQDQFSTRSGSRIGIC